MKQKNLAKNLKNQPADAKESRFRIFFSALFLTVIICFLVCAVFIADYNMRNDAFPEAKSVFLIAVDETQSVSVQIMGKSYSFHHGLIQGYLQLRSKADMLISPAFQFLEQAIYKGICYFLREV